jgi:hypothetical protein
LLKPSSAQARTYPSDEVKAYSLRSDQTINSSTNHLLTFHLMSGCMKCLFSARISIDSPEVAASKNIVYSKLATQKSMQQLPGDENSPFGDQKILKLCRLDGFKSPTYIFRDTANRPVHDFCRKSALINQHELSDSLICSIWRR